MCKAGKEEEEEGEGSLQDWGRGGGEATRVKLDLSVEQICLRNVPLLDGVRLDDDEGGERGDKLVAEGEEKCPLQVVANHWHPHLLLLPSISYSRVATHQLTLLHPGQQVLDGEVGP